MDDSGCDSNPHVSAATKCLACVQDPRTARYLLPDYVPVERFGSLESVKAVTIGINPAPNKPHRRAIPRVPDFGKTRRSELSADDLVSISELQTAYFRDGPAHPFFDNNFYFVLHTIDPSWTYQSGNVSHVDVVFCVTDPLWSELGRSDRNAQSRIRQNCRKHFFRTLRSIPPGTWLLWGGNETVTALDELSPRIDDRGTTSVKAVKWKMGEVEIGEKSYPFMAWDKVGAGMSNDDRCEIGELVRRARDNHHTGK